MLDRQRKERLAVVNKAVLAELPGAPAALPMVRLEGLSQSSCSPSLVVSLAIAAILLVSNRAHSGILHEPCQRDSARFSHNRERFFC